MLNNHQSHFPKKPFTPTTLKSLHQQTNSPTHKLLQKLYINFVLTSEIIDHTIPKSITFDQEGFWIGDSNIIDFDRYAFLRFEGDRAFYVDAKEEFWHRKVQSDSELYYSPSQEGWFGIVDNPTIEDIDLDELYFNKTKKKAHTIQYISINSQKEPYAKFHIKRLEKETQGLFGVKYRYRVVNNLVCYLDTKGVLRLLATPSDTQIEKLSNLGLKLKKRSLILYTDANQKATKNDIESFHSTVPYKNKLFYQNKKIGAKEVFYLNEPELVDKIESDSNVYFINPNDIEVYFFQAVHILYTNAKGEKRYILYKSEKFKKKGTVYHYEKNAKGIIDKRQQNLIPKEYNHNYSTQVYHTAYELLFLSTPQEHTLPIHRESLHYRRSLQIGEIKIDIFPQLLEGVLDES